MRGAHNNVADALFHGTIQDTEDGQASVKSPLADLGSGFRCTEESASNLNAPIPDCWRCWQAEMISGKLEGSAMFAE